MCRGGDITDGNGMGGESIYGRSFDMEIEFKKKELHCIHHEKRGILSMVTDLGD